MSPEQYRAMLFDTASEFQTDDADELARIDRVLARQVALYTSLGKSSSPIFSEIVVYATASELKRDQLSKANQRGIASVRSSSEQIAFSTGNSGNPYQLKLKELLSGDAVPGTTDLNPRRSFGVYIGGSRGIY